MLNMRPLTGNIMRIEAAQKLGADDFLKFAPQVDGFINHHGSIRILVDATAFDGWENTEAFENHMRFVRDHQRSVVRIALVAGHQWQHWVAGIFRLFVHPQVQVFDKGEEAQALAWLEA